MFREWPVLSGAAIPAKVGERLRLVESFRQLRSGVIQLRSFSHPRTVPKNDRLFVNCLPAVLLVRK